MTTIPRKNCGTINGWIGHVSWINRICSPLNTTDATGKQHGTLFVTRKDAVAAGWNTPARVEITIKRMNNASI